MTRKGGWQGPQWQCNLDLECTSIPSLREYMVSRELVKRRKAKKVNVDDDLLLYARNDSDQYPFALGIVQCFRKLRKTSP